MIKEISTIEVSSMTEREGLVLQGCGGDLTEWENGITDMLREEGILPLFTEELLKTALSLPKLRQRFLKQQSPMLL